MSKSFTKIDKVDAYDRPITEYEDKCKRVKVRLYEGEKDYYIKIFHLYNAGGDEAFNLTKESTEQFLDILNDIKSRH